jgi:hypothetical protein
LVWLKLIHLLENPLKLLDDEGDKILFGTDHEMPTMFTYFKRKWNSDEPKIHVEGINYIR